MIEDWEVPVDRMDVSAFTVPTSSAEADGTLAWDETTIVVVQVSAAGTAGLGYTYADLSSAVLVDQVLKRIVRGSSAFRVP